MLFQVSIDFSLPLCRGRLISLNNEKQLWVTFKHERLPNICYWCDRLTHDDRDYDLWIESEGTIRIDQREFRTSLRSLTFAVSRKSVMNVPGYYTTWKKTSPGTGGTFQATAEKDTDQPHPPVRTTAPE